MAETRCQIQETPTKDDKKLIPWKVRITLIVMVCLLKGAHRAYKNNKYNTPTPQIQFTNQFDNIQVRYNCFLVPNTETVYILK